jgi:hypothetical protein
MVFPPLSQRAIVLKIKFVLMVQQHASQPVNGDSLSIHTGVTLHRIPKHASNGVCGVAALF